MYIKHANLLGNIIIHIKTQKTHKDLYIKPGTFTLNKEKQLHTHSKEETHKKRY